MSFQILKNEGRFERLSTAMSNALGQNKHIKVLIPYDGSESGDAALDDLRRAGLPQAVDALVAVTNVWLPLSPYEITRAVSARRMKVLRAGASSFVPALRDYEEQRALSLEAERHISSILPSGIVRAEPMRDTAAVASEVLRKAKQWKAELIIVGSQTSPSPDITDYAGPALKLAREANCTVRIARASDQQDESPVRIIIGIDGLDFDLVVQAVAVRSWPPKSEARLVAVGKDGPRDLRKDSETTLRLEEAAQKLRAKGLAVSNSSRNGNPQEVLIDEAQEFAADCIFIDARGFSHDLDGSFNGWNLSRTAEALVLGAPCSVEVVRTRKLDGPDLEPAA